MKISEIFRVRKSTSLSREQSNVKAFDDTLANGKRDDEPAAIRTSSDIHSELPTTSEFLNMSWDVEPAIASLNARVEELTKQVERIQRAYDDVSFLAPLTHQILKEQLKQT